MKTNLRTLTALLSIVFAISIFAGQAAPQNLTVTRIDDRNNGMCVPGDCSLREAVNAANASGTDDTINFSPDLTNIMLTDEIVISNAGALAINGPGANVLSIHAGTAGHRIFHTIGATVTIAGVTLTGARGDLSGGAIFADNFGSAPTVTLDGVNITDNGVSGDGGGVYYGGGGTFRIINSTFSSNAARWGGGFYYDGFGGNLLVVNTTISGNSAPLTGIGGGGGFVTDCGGIATLRNVTVTNNYSAIVGGGIYQATNYSFYNCDEAINLGNTILAGNTANFFPGVASPNFYSEAVSSPFKDVGGNFFDSAPILGPLQNNGGPVSIP